MTESASPVLASWRLFHLCADHLDNDEYWLLFVRRFNPLLSRYVAVTWRRYGQGKWLPADIADDLLQEIYATILKNGARLLRDFHGATEAEARSYLAQAAINQTLSYLRSRSTLKRAAEEVSLHAMIEEQEEIRLPNNSNHLLKSLTQREFIDIVRRLFTGANAERNILLLLLNLHYGYSVAEITRMKLCDLKESSIANLIRQMKLTLKKYLSEGF